MSRKLEAKTVGAALAANLFGKARGKNLFACKQAPTKH